VRKTTFPSMVFLFIVIVLCPSLRKAVDRRVTLVAVAEV
jgi:hypothetical protein